MPKGSKELTESRKEEIVDACAELYKTMSFREMTIKEIGDATSFTRTSVYNYFQTKEEIFLALLRREYMLWTDRLHQLRTENITMDRLAFADAVAHSLEQRKNLLKLLSMNHYDMEENSREERLVEFKVVYGRALAEMRSCLRQFFPEMTDDLINDFIYAFFPFMFGIYPYAYVTEKQKRAMEKAGVEFTFMSVYDIAFAEIKRLLGI